MKTSEKRIRSVLKRLITDGVDRGAQFAVYRDGELVLDVSAGVAHPFTKERVTTETLFPVFSVTKGISATVIHRLVERGLLSYEMRISDVWPEFGVRGKKTITLRHALSHTAGVSDWPAQVCAPGQRSRLARGVSAPVVTFGQMLDWTTACAALAQTKPKWRPGVQFCYHAKTYGWLIGEVARRVVGKSFTDLVRDEIARPLGLDTLYAGLPDPENHQIAFLEESHLGPLPVPDFAELSVMEAPQVLIPHQMNCPEMQKACLPSSNGLMNARAIARHYAALLPGGVAGIELLPATRVAIATKWDPRKDPAGEPACWGLGYARAEIAGGGKKIEGFGHGGYGGSMGCAFPELGLAIGYTRNRLGPSGWDALTAGLLDTK